MATLTNIESKFKTFAKTH